VKRRRTPARKKWARTGRIYLAKVGAAGVIQIGYTTAANVCDRLTYIAVPEPFTFAVVLKNQSQSEEFNFHRQFAEFRLAKYERGLGST